MWFQWRKYRRCNRCNCTGAQMPSGAHEGRKKKHLSVRFRQGWTGHRAYRANARGADAQWAGHPPPPPPPPRRSVGKDRLAIGGFVRFPEPPAVILYLRPPPPPPSTIAITPPPPPPYEYWFLRDCRHINVKCHYMTTRGARIRHVAPGPAATPLTATVWCSICLGV